MRRLPALALAFGLLAAPALAGDAVLRATPPGGTELVLQARGVGDRWAIRVTAAGRDVQRIEVETEVPDAPPFLADADGDGASDLFVQVSLGNGNAAYELWTYDRAAARFRRAGEVAGIAFGRDGALLVSLARDGCCGAAYAFQGFTPTGTLEDRFAIEVGLGPEGRPSRCAPAPGSAVPSDVLRRTCALRLGTLPNRFGPPR